MQIDDTRKLTVQELYDCLKVVCAYFYDLHGRVDSATLAKYLIKPNESKMRKRAEDALGNFKNSQAVRYFVDMFIDLCTVLVSKLQSAKRILEELNGDIGGVNKTDTISYNINKFENDNSKISNQIIKENLQKLEKLIEEKIKPCLSAFSQETYKNPMNQKILNTIKNNINTIIKNLKKSKKNEIINSKEWKDVKKLVNSAEPFYIGDRMGEFAILKNYIDELDIQ